MRIHFLCFRNELETLWQSKSEIKAHVTAAAVTITAHCLQSVILRYSMGSQAGPPMKIKVVSIDHTPCDLNLRDLKFYLKKFSKRKLEFSKRSKSAILADKVWLQLPGQSMAAHTRSDVFRDLAKT